MWGRAVLLVLLAALATAADDDSQLQVGKSINIFSRYGYLSLSMKVVSRNDSDWIFREPTLDIFVDLEELPVRHQRFAKSQAFQGELNIEFCEDVDQLLQAYFRSFSFEMLGKPWQAFTASWSRDNIARYMGINSSFVSGDYRYVLVRLLRFRDRVVLPKLPNNIRLTGNVADEIEGIEVGDVYSVVKFIQKFGTHYIESFVTGNSLYQVIVYKKNIYHQVKDRFKNRRTAEVSSTEIRSYFSPWYAEHLGSIKVASGNKTIEAWAASRLRVNHYVFSYASLFTVKGDTQLVRYLNDLLKNEAILEMNMRAVAPAFKDPIKRKWFVEVLDNYLKLWDSNM